MNLRERQLWRQKEDAMPNGPGKYDPECTQALLSTKAVATVLVVIGGDRGNGFSVTSTDPEAIKKLSALLRMMADQIDDAN